MSHADALLARFAGLQHGLVLRSQAHACGLSTGAIAHRIARGRLMPATQRVLAVGGSPDTEWQRAMAAVLEAGHGGCLAFDSAAAVYGIPGYRLEPLHVWRVRDRSRKDNLLGVQHKTRRLPAHHIRRHLGIPVTTPARMAADQAARLSPARLLRTVDEGWGRNLFGYRSLITITDEMRQRGRKGIPMLRDLVDDLGPSYRPPASNLERRVMTLLAEAGIDGFERQVDVIGEQGWIGRVDFRHEVYPLVLEVQSDLFHAGRTNQARDAARIRQLTDAGLVVVELWEFEIWHRPQRALELVREGRRLARQVPLPAHRAA